MDIMILIAILGLIKEYISFVYSVWKDSHKRK